MAVKLTRSRRERLRDAVRPRWTQRTTPGVLHDGSSQKVKLFLLEKLDQENELLVLKLGVLVVALLAATQR